jgi:membrane-associated phospholipid phosphatase
METDRDRYMSEILAQYDSAPFFWLRMMGLTKGSKPATIRLGHVCLRIGEMVAIFYKKIFLRPRPNIICPALQPPLGPPGHPAFPSGHALQGWLLTKWLVEITGGPGTSIYQTQLEWLAERVAINRERAGIHYRSDSIAGKHLAQIVFKWMYDIGKPPIPSIGSDEPSKAPILSAMIEAARKEWT